MKRIIFVLVISGFISCSKQAENGLPDQRAVADRSTSARAIDARSSYDERIQIYNLMKETERYNLWFNHLKNAKKQFTDNRETSKANLVAQLMEHLSVGIFASFSSTEKDVFLNYFIPSWLNNARTTFTSLEIYDLTFDPTSVSIGNRASLPPDEGSANCFCHVGNSGYSCTKVTVSFPWGVTVSNGMCEGSVECRASMLGCGLLWLESCNGGHCNY